MMLPNAGRSEPAARAVERINHAPIQTAEFARPRSRHGARAHRQLTEAEATFRALKSELSIRPIFHQLERRAKAHILVAFLGYAMWVTLKHLLLRRQSNLSPARALDLLSRLHSADIILPTTEGREIRLRRITTPTAEQQALLHQLDLHLPKRLGFDTECSADFVIA